MFKDQNKKLWEDKWPKSSKKEREDFLKFLKKAPNVGLFEIDEEGKEVAAR